jgi:beta-glucanase (GH16 family)
MQRKTFTRAAIFLLFTSLHAQQRVPSFADEFNVPQLDLARWVPHDPQDSLNQDRLNDKAPVSPAASDLRISGGQLHIPPGGALSTFGIFAQTYGRFEILAKAPTAKGLRARFRLMPVPFGSLPAIDIFEASGTPAKISLTNRWGTEQTERSFAESLSSPDLSAEFHTIAVEWTREHISWLIDGKEKFRSIDGIPHQPMYLLLDLAGAGPATETLDVDYVRVYTATP